MTTQGDRMNGTEKKSTLYPGRKGRIVAAWIFIILLVAVLPAYGQSGSQKVFPSPLRAVEALVAAAGSGTPEDLRAIFGTEGEAIISSGDESADRSARDRFIEAYKKGHRITYTGKRRAVLTVGKDNWSFPVPLVRVKKGWIFDTAAGKTEIINRRIGRNELAAMGIMKGYVDAQNRYFAKDWDDDGTYEYAQKIGSTEGKKDGLYWEPGPGEEKSPFGPFVAKAAQERSGAEAGKLQPYRGYYFKVLKGQGKDAAGGAYDYVVKDRMIFGFGLLAYPAAYGVSGIHSFIVNQEGKVFEKNLGPATEQQAQTIDRYNPDSTWKEVKLP